MDLQTSLITYAVSVVVVYLVARQMGIYMFSAIVLALIVGIVILSYLYPITATNLIKSSEETSSTIYTAIHTITPVAILIYAVFKIFSDRTDLVETQKIQPIIVTHQM